MPTTARLALIPLLVLLSTPLACDWFKEACEEPADKEPAPITGTQVWEGAYQHNGAQLCTESASGQMVLTLERVAGTAVTGKATLGDYVAEGGGLCEVKPGPHEFAVEGEAGPNGVDLYLKKPGAEGWSLSLSGSISGKTLQARMFNTMATGEFALNCTSNCEAPKPEQSDTCANEKRDEIDQTNGTVPPGPTLRQVSVGVTSIGLGKTWEVRKDGSLWFWGGGQMTPVRNDLRAAGDQSSVIYKWKAVSAFQDAVAAIREDGTLWAEGVLMSANPQEYIQTKQLGTFTDWIEVSLGQGVWGIRKDGSLWQYYPTERQHGAGTVWQKLGGRYPRGKPLIDQSGIVWNIPFSDATLTLGTPVQPGVPTAAISVDAAGEKCAVGADKSLWCWGRINDGTGTEIASPVRHSTTGWTRYSAGGYFSCGIRDKSLYCRGETDGALSVGNGTASDAPEFVQVGAPGVWSDVSVGERNACAVQTNDSLWCWGQNTKGEVGDGTTTPRLVPTKISD